VVVGEVIITIILIVIMIIITIIIITIIIIIIIIIIGVLTCWSRSGRRPRCVRNCQSSSSLSADRSPFASPSEVVQSVACKAQQVTTGCHHGSEGSQRVTLRHTASHHGSSQVIHDGSDPSHTTYLQPLEEYGAEQGPHVLGPDVTTTTGQVRSGLVTSERTGDPRLRH
jgi:hypothetical protein